MTTEQAAEDSCISPILGQLTRLYPHACRYLEISLAANSCGCGCIQTGAPANSLPGRWLAKLLEMIE